MNDERLTKEQALAVVHRDVINHPGGKFVSPLIFQAADVLASSLQSTEAEVERLTEELRDCNSEADKEARDLEQRITELEEGLRRLFSDAFVDTAQGQPCFRTSNGVPQGMPRRAEKSVRAARSLFTGERR